MKTLILADNQDITKAGILYLSERMLGFKPVLEAADRKELVPLLIANPTAVVVFDYTLFDLSDAEELVILQARFKQIQWILFSEELSEDFIRRVIFRSETFSIVMKDTTVDEILCALQSALQSERFICQRILNMLSHRKAVSEQEARPALTPTEKDILKAIARGKTNKEIAAERFSSIHTITTHRKNIFRKLEVNNVHEATKYALRAGILDAVDYYI